MKRSRFTEEQITGIRREREAGAYLLSTYEMSERRAYSCTPGSVGQMSFVWGVSTVLAIRFPFDSRRPARR
ncbi:hypothetical protein CSW62_21915 [Caulobacter sp. FWC2]|nr:hypothetical protein CSW62_21915 [Caulobacter sp. FWC2]